MTVKCAVKKCRRRFRPKAWNHRFCKQHAAESCYRHRFEYEQRLKQRDPEGRAEYHRSRQRIHRRNVKNEVLSFYGKRKTLRCRWRGCKVTDVDMLSLDHIANDGKKDRKKLNLRGGGHRAYLWIKRYGFPKGFQTLCFNHQFKKEISRRRKARE